MDCDKLLECISNDYQRALGKNLVGIVHGSLAFGCFNWNKSDIDFIVVVKHALNQKEKEALIQTLLELDAAAPPKGFEMSVVLEAYCAPFIYPPPFELHYSNTYREHCRQDLTQFCQTMNGTDRDLAAHFKVITTVGCVLCGKPIEEVFGDVPRAFYLDSILLDIENSPKEIYENSIYIILNLCRVLAL